MFKKLFSKDKRIGNHNQDLTNSKDFIQINDLEKSFQVGESMVPVLKGLDFEVERGEFIAITGPSGNGKSTLLNMITGIDRPTSGDVIVGGQMINKLNENQLAMWRGENLGIIFQFFQMLPSLSLVQNVILPMEFAGKYRRRERQERALELLDRVGLADQANKLPGTVSGGQQQRAAIARALANDPPLLIADEPTGNLDSQTAENIFSLFQELVAEGKTMLMVTHDVEIAQRMPRIIEIRDGIIACDSIAAPEIFRQSELQRIPVERS
jgi:putative ABC transport system ATP-binding protein